MRQINLLPEQLQKAERTRIARNVLIATIGFPLVALFLLHFLLAFNVGALKKAAAQPLPTQETAASIQLREEVAGVKAEIQKLVDEKKEALEIFSKHFSSSNILKIIGDVAVDKVWLRGLDLDLPNGVCQIKGKSFNTRLVSEFMLGLKKLPYFDGVELVSMEKAGKGTKEEVNFEIVCNIRRLLEEKQPADK